MKSILPERLAVISTTLFLLYQCNPRAFTSSAIASAPEPFFFPTIIFAVTNPRSNKIVRTTIWHLFLIWLTADLMDRFIGKP